jgi:DNA repair exonuclease SbcCD ATPase subunit
MQIIKLKASNFMGVKAVEINPDGSIVTLSGANEAGKSSILNSIAATLGAKIPDLPIRKGETKAEITVVLDKYEATRSITRSKGGGFSHSLVVKDMDGEPKKKPQTILDDLLGELTFDPFKFSNMKDKERREVLVEITGLDLSKLEAQRTGLYDKRTDVGRLKKRDAGAADKLKPEDPDSIPDEAIDVGALSKEKDIVTDQIRDYEMAEVDQKQIGEKIKGIEDGIEELKKQLKKSRHQEEELSRIIDEGGPRIEEKRKRLIKINDEIESSTKENERIADKKTWKAAEAQAKDYKDEYDELTSRIEAVDDAKKKAIKAANMPVKGLSFSEDGVMLDDIPFSQVNKSKRLRASMEIAIATNPKIRVIMIEDGSLLDTESMKIVKEMAEEHDFQIWIEVVDESGEVGIFIEDGSIKEAA